MLFLEQALTHVSHYKPALCLGQGNGLRLGFPPERQAGVDGLGPL